ncbi:hypothetical protein [Floridanema evergladense]|uniref:Uncharacterized protein n=1 Tax=Floridaenema evergladense BLCC-F167 TaxID=3153639 RepID=A0ABV4WSJ5_9CYAN
MVLRSSQSEQKLPSIEMLPDSLKVLLNKIKQQHYAELYELEADGTTSLQDDLNEILQAFRISNQTLTHLRYVWMTLILLLVVEPTLEYYQPKDSSPTDIILEISLWLIANTKKILNDEVKTIEFDDRELLKKDIIGNYDLSHDTNKNPVSLQVLYEAQDVFKNAIRVLDYEQSVEAIIEILDDCLEGYAIFPGSYGRRELFEWWLLEVVPASWFLLMPKSFYVVEDLPNKEEIRLRQIRIMEKIIYFL